MHFLDATNFQEDEDLPRNIGVAPAALASAEWGSQLTSRCDNKNWTFSEIRRQRPIKTSFFI